MQDSKIKFAGKLLACIVVLVFGLNIEIYLFGHWHQVWKDALDNPYAGSTLGPVGGIITGLVIMAAATFMFINLFINKD